MVWYGIIMSRQYNIIRGPFKCYVNIYIYRFIQANLSRVIYDLIAVFYYTNRAKELSRDDLVTT